jgi:hypothetical protein
MPRALPGGKYFHFALIHAPESKVRGANPPQAPGRQSIRLKMRQWELEAGFSFEAE